MENEGKGITVLHSERIGLSEFSLSLSHTHRHTHNLTIKMHQKFRIFKIITLIVNVY